MDISNPVAPVETGFYEIIEDGIFNVLLADDYVLAVKTHVKEGRLIADRKYVGSLRRIEKSNPLSMIEINSLDLQINALDMVVSGSYVYIAYGREGLQVIDISDPLNPNKVGFYNTPNGAWDVAMSDEAEDYLYVIDSRGAVYILQFTPTLSGNS